MASPSIQLDPSLAGSARDSADAPEGDASWRWEVIRPYAGWGLAVRAPMFKYWSPMSVGAWGLMVFGFCAFASFVATLWPERWPGRWLHRRWLRHRSSRTPTA